MNNLETEKLSEGPFPDVGEEGRLSSLQKHILVILLLHYQSTPLEGNKQVVARLLGVPLKIIRIHLKRIFNDTSVSASLSRSLATLEKRRLVTRLIVNKRGFIDNNGRTTHVALADAGHIEVALMAKKEYHTAMNVLSNS